MRIKGRKEFIPYALFEAFKVQDQGLHRCPITATMKSPEKSSTSYPIYLEAPTFNVRKKRSVFILFSEAHI